MTYEKNGRKCSKNRPKSSSMEFYVFVFIWYGTSDSNKTKSYLYKICIKLTAVG